MILNQKQLEAGSDWKDPRISEICYDGGARSGKTYGIIIAIIERAVKYPGSRHLISRLRGNHLETTVWRQTFLPILREMLTLPSYTIDRVYRTVTLKNGSEIIGLALEDIDRIAKIMGTEFATVFINEATQITYGTYQTLKTRCVQNIEGCINKIVIDCNPANQLHWINKYFLQKKDPATDEPIKNPDRLKRRGPWLPTDNRYLSAAGIEAINSLTGVQYERLALGQWVSQEGLVYPEYSEVIIEPFVLPKDVEISSATDFGYTNPFATLFVAKHYASEIYYVFDEYYVREKTVAEHCKNLQSFQSKWFQGRIKLQFHVADHDAEDRATMAANGFITQAADKDIRTGIDSVRRLLIAKKGWRLRIFSTCTNLINEFDNYRWPEKKTGTDIDEKPVKGDDHLLDCLRYWSKRAGSGSGIHALGRIR